MKNRRVFHFLSVFIFWVLSRPAKVFQLNWNCYAVCTGVPKTFSVSTYSMDRIARKRQQS